MESPNWERSVLEKVALAAVTEQRRARRWQIFFRLCFLAIFILVFSTNLLGDHGADPLAGTPHAALLKLEGEISQDNKNVANFIDSLQEAFSNKQSQVVIIQANSPGGSPVISGRIHDEILRLRAKHKDIPLVVVVEEMCASGCYYIAAAADKIFVDKASLIGSIGVISGGFGFAEAISGLGIERRVQTAGNNKALGDPFLPENPEAKAWRQKLLDNIHQQFIDVVKKGRGKRLKNDPDIFSGLVWLGEQSIPLGLADGLGSVHSVAQEHVKSGHIVDFSPEGDIFDRFAKQLGAQIRAGVFMMQHSIY